MIKLAPETHHTETVMVISNPHRVLSRSLLALPVVAISFTSVLGDEQQKSLLVIPKGSIAFHLKPGGAVFMSNEFNGGYKIQFSPAGSNRPAKMYLLHPPFTNGEKYVTTGGTFDKIFENIPIPQGFDPYKAYKLEYFGLDFK